MVTGLSRIKPVHKVIYYIQKMHFNIIPPPMFESPNPFSPSTSPVSIKLPIIHCGLPHLLLLYLFSPTIFASSRTCAALNCATVSGFLLQYISPVLNGINIRVKREKPTRCNYSDVYYQTSISTCFGHHYAHHQENKTMYYRIWCSALVVLAMVVWSCVVSCVHTTTASTTSAEHHMR